MMAYDCNSITWEARVRESPLNYEPSWITEFKANLDYILSSRPAWSTNWVQGQSGLHSKYVSQDKVIRSTKIRLIDLITMNFLEHIE